jgi:dienelactone hydrolase
MGTRGRGGRAVADELHGSQLLGRPIPDRGLQRAVRRAAGRDDHRTVARHARDRDASAKDTTGHTWTSQAVYAADPSGKVDPATAAPLDGSYSGVSDTGLLWSMTAEGSSYYVEPDGVMAVHLTASLNHHQVATADLTRQMRGAGVTEHTTTVAQEGFDGVMYTPGDTGVRRPALLAFGGSEGGTFNGVLVARAVAAKGYPALGIGYFKAPGLPDSLTNIPLEYFANALRWLAKQPGVDPRHIDVYGVSRGSEAALLLGVDFPDLVFGVVAASPSSVVNGGLPDSTQPAWTLHGQPVPAAPLSDSNDPHPADAPAAIIPAERITGPVLIVCGDSDRLWESCAYSDALSDRLGSHPHTERREPGAGHFVGALVPNVPYEPSAREGGFQQGDALGRLDAWANLLTFLAAQAS